jgi:hypothetical protein
MNQEDEEFNRIERESKQRMEAVYQEVQKRNKAMNREYVRPWVGLTREEILEARWHNKSSYKFARVLEDMLKERNT